MKNRGFTLIELLVVISIIGVIASIVLVSFSGSRDKAKLAKSQQFSANINHSLGAYAVGIWRFEEAAGIDIHDESGYGNHGTFYGNPTPVFPDGVYSGTKALQFDGVNDYVDCGSNASLDIVGTGDMTIEAWIFPKTSTSNKGTVVSKWLPWIYSFFSGNRIGLYARVNGGDQNIRANTNITTIDQWHHIAVVYTFSDHTVYHYLNGKSDGSGSFTDRIENRTGANVRIGIYGSTSYPFNGAIDDVRIYSEALSAGQIQQHYAAGAQKHGLSLK
ncbi:prepilin-type N-terminal cleavage/methylation domain-containing protein [Candidatus Parcubacteria bacterium]|nr:prepilin-type N-terminal cleavage/methylation domain-containing protein [Candidatus Parcubacteria bacterium]